MTLEELRATRLPVEIDTALKTMPASRPRGRPIAAYHYDLPMGPAVIIQSTLGYEHAWHDDTEVQPTLEAAETALWEEYARFQ
jgi:hypothetical protein